MQAVKQVGSTHQRVLDAAVTITAALLVLLAARGQHPGARPLDLLGTGVILGTTLPVLVRRRFPLSVLLLACAGSLAYSIIGYWGVVDDLALLAALVTVASRHPVRVSVPATVLGGGVLTTSAIMADTGPVWLALLVACGLAGATLAFGRSRRAIAERNARLAQLTEALHRDRAARARRAVTEERIRIAGELHEIVTEHLSVLPVQAELAQCALDGDLPAAHGALGVIADTSGDALVELRRMQALLRIEGEEFDEDRSTAGLSRLPELLRRARAAGLRADLVVRGVERGLPSGIDLCAYRVVQEALANVLKHAGPAEATVTLTYRPGGFVAAVTDNGAGRGPAPDGVGIGLVGMRERAEVYGGSLTAGRRAPGPGYVVELALPLPMEPGSVVAEPQGRSRVFD